MRWWRKRPVDTCLVTANALEIPHPFDLQNFCASIAEQRGRPLFLLPLDGSPDPDFPCGMWIGLDTADLVFYEATATGILRVQIILHEISHMLLGHVAPQLSGREDASEEELDAMSDHFEGLLSRTSQAVDAQPPLPVADLLRAEADRLRSMAAAEQPIDEELGLSANRIVRLLGRTNYVSRQERDAETLATFILERASRNEARPTCEKSGRALARLSEDFGHPVRR
ncbi:hypothetical protein DMH15_21750 [Streptomyces sp. WAC 06725]|uniref:hypothetical protein n=1 Tax=Streptomyces sp. WAC 06725 TaxID=2203209 RepID=UPI000F73A38F|nr:hypothetical protein [Streptomyces sp. WAC 06725]RSO33517.1 hypothetical protein DMH15_21750 [Streptomyces sp. WAC 06725]